jgi:hypothetical protein
MIHLSVCCCGRAVPLLWKVLEHDSATVSFSQYEVLLRKARWLLRQHQDVMLLADRAFACHDLVAVGKLAPPVNEAKCYHNVRLWADGLHCSNLVLATVKGAKDSLACFSLKIHEFAPLNNYPDFI